MRPRADENTIWRARVADTDYFQFTALHGLSDGRDLHERIVADGRKEAVEVGETVWFDARNIESRARHLDDKPHAVFRQALRRDDPPVAAVFGDGNRFEFFRDRAGLAVPDVVEILELQRQLQAGPAVEQEMEMTGGAVGRVAFMVVKQMDQNRPVSGELVPKRRRVFDAGVNELQTVLFPAGVAAGLSRRAPTTAGTAPSTT